MADRSLRGQVAVVGVGETDLLPARPGADEPEFVLCLQGDPGGVSDAGIDPTAHRRLRFLLATIATIRRALATALGCNELRFSNMQWGGGGGGGAGAMANAAAAVATGLADCVVVYRALAQGQFGRFGQGPQANTVSAATWR